MIFIDSRHLSCFMFNTPNDFLSDSYYLLFFCEFLNATNDIDSL